MRYSYILSILQLVSHMYCTPVHLYNKHFYTVHLYHDSCFCARPITHFQRSCPTPTEHLWHLANVTTSRVNTRMLGKGFATLYPLLCFCLACGAIYQKVKHLLFFSAWDFNSLYYITFLNVLKWNPIFSWISWTWCFFIYFCCGESNIFALT